MTTAMKTFAFDVYGTLIDTAGVTASLYTHVGGKAAQFAQRWREKQLEYSFRRGLMSNYGGFPQCIRNSLDYVCEELQEDLDGEIRQALMQSYRVLPAFDDAVPGLTELKKHSARLFAFSNGMPEDVENLLYHAGILDFFEDVVSVDEVKAFKPDPQVYQHFLTRAEARAEDSWLVSSNPFDVIGAVNFGMQAAWIRRSEKSLFDPWEQQPTRTLSSLSQLVDIVD